MKPTLLWKAILALSVVGIFTPQTPAQVTIATTRPAVARREPRIIRMTVSPAALPAESLKYSFVPGAIDQVEGNAALFYMRAMLLYQTKDVEKDDELFDEYLEGPIDGPKRSEVQKRLAKYNSAIEQLRMGALRDSCRWETGVREKGISALLPELNQIRTLTRLLAAQARIQIANKQYDEAIGTLRTGFSMAWGVAQRPVLIQGLVAIGCDAILLNAARDLAQQPDAPNLYWALASLPHPIVDPRQVMLWEKDFLYFTFPQLRNAAKSPMSAAEWTKLWADLTSLTGANQPDAAQAMLLASAVRDYAKAKQYLVGKGFTAEQVEKMPVIQVVGIYFLHSFEQASDNMWKWWLVPYPQAREGMERSVKELQRMRAQDPGNLIFVLLPAVNTAYTRFAWIEREVAAAQTVEALRAHVAAHNGQLPKSLDELAETPASHDPTTGKPFGYTVDGKMVILESRSESGDMGEGLRVEVTFR